MKNESQQSTKVCSNCGRPDTLRSGIKGGVAFADLCDRCIGTIGSADFSRQFDRQSQRRTFAKDIVQSTERDYAKIYGEAAARKRGWTDSDLHKYG
jgi:hypothetical protein